MATCDELATQLSELQSLLIPPPVDKNVSCAWKPGGRLLSRVQLCLLFWGSAWTQNVNPSMQNIVTAAGSMLSSPYMSALRAWLVLWRRPCIPGPQTITTLAAMAARIKPVTRGSKNEPLTGKRSQVTLIVMWKSAMPKTLLPVLLKSQTIITRAATV